MELYLLYYAAVLAVYFITLFKSYLFPPVFTVHSRMSAGTNKLLDTAGRPQHGTLSVWSRGLCRQPLLNRACGRKCQSIEFNFPSLARDHVQMTNSGIFHHSVERRIERTRVASKLSAPLPVSSGCQRVLRHIRVQCLHCHLTRQY